MIENKKYLYIDCLRGVAIILVIMNHINGFLNTNVLYSFFPSFLEAFIVNTRFGVQLFFIVSAFTLMMSIYNRKEEIHALRSFYIRRFFRIAPMYYLAIIYFTGAFLNFTLSSEGWSNVSLKGLILSFFFLNGLLPSTINSYVPGGWSITVEFMFYIILPLLFIKIKSTNSAILFIVISMFISALLFYLLKDTSFQYYHYLDYYLINQLPIFGLGILAYYISKNKVELSLSYLFLLLVGVYFVNDYLLINKAQYYGFIFFFLLLATSLNQKLLKWNFLATVGKYSFSLYLVHFIIIDITNRFIHISIEDYVTNFFNAIIIYIISFIILFTLSLIVSIASYKYIEIPGQNLGRKLIKKLNS